MPLDHQSRGLLNNNRHTSQSYTTSDSHSSNTEIPGISTFDSTVPQPSPIRINVEGAFIVDEDESNGRQTPPGTRDIALPHHNSELSHIAVDVSLLLFSFKKKIFFFQKLKNINKLI